MEASTYKFLRTTTALQPHVLQVVMREGTLVGQLQEIKKLESEMHSQAPAISHVINKEQDDDGEDGGDGDGSVMMMVKMVMV